MKLKRMFTSVVVALSLLIPAGIVAAPAAHATTPVGCRTDQFLHDIFCYRVTGPKGTTFVDVFEGSIQNIGSGPISVVVKIYGPTYFSGPVNYFNEVGSTYERVVAKQTIHWFVPIFRHVTQGEYCAREWTFIHDSASICWWVFVQP